MIELKKEQLDAINHEQGDLLVSASAGSGKTFVMIERLIRLISQKKADVSQVLAVTFTESAAADMKEKLKKALIKEVMKTGDEYLLEEYKKVATADISTLHSFCARLIRIYFYVAGVSHDFAIADETAAQSLRKDAINKTFRYFYKQQDPVFKKVALFHAHKRADKQFKDQILSLYAFFSTEAHPDKLKEKFSSMYQADGLERFSNEFVSLFHEELLDAKEKVEEAYFTATTLGKPKLLAFAEGVLSDFNLYLSAKNTDELYRLKTYQRTVSTETKLDGVALQVKTDVVDGRNVLKKAVESYLSCLFDKDTMISSAKKLKEHADCLIKIVDKFTEYYAELKREENVLDFDDLQHYALKVLSDADVLNAVKQKYKYIFVDEYQDVNGVQEEIINTISSNNVFMVGDVKQSIYGFRGCRPDFFLDKFDKMSKVKGQTALLNHSFRSSLGVINAVNEVFSYCMNEKYFGLDYKKTSKLVPGGIYKEDALGRAELHFLQKEPNEKRGTESPRVYNVLEEIKEAESDCAKISSLITKIINDETTKTFYDPKEDKERYVTYKDIAVLTRKRDSVYATDLINGLKKHNIPVVSDASEDITNHPEIQVMINVLKLIDCFIDNIPLATVLKSPIGGFSDEDFAEMCLYYTKNAGAKLINFSDAYDYYLQNGDGKIKEKLLNFDDYFEKIRTLSDFMSAYDVLTKIVIDCKLEAHLYASTDGENKVNRLRKFMDFCAKKQYTVKELLTVLSENGNGIGYLPVEEADAVKVMTIHASKGLEFPVVIVCGLEKPFAVRYESAEFLTDKDDGVAIKLYDDDLVVKENIWRTVFQKRMRKATVTEEMRILYVALTRASYSLHMAFEGETDKRKHTFNGALNFVDCIPASMPATIVTEDDLDFEELKKGTRKVIIGRADEKQTDIIGKNYAFAYDYLDDTTLPLKSSVTALLTGSEEQKPFVMFDEYDGETDKERGIIAHKFMENVDFSADPIYETERLLKDETLSEEEIKKIDIEKLLQVLKSDVFRFGGTAKTYREQSFIVSIPASKIFDVKSDSDILLQGIIDLLVVDGDKAKIIDYKYSRLSNAGLKQKYSKQLDLYAYATEKILGVKVTDKIIVSLLSGQIIKID